MTDTLPSDEEYLTYVHEVWGDEAYVSSLRHSFDPVAFEEQFRVLVASGIYREEDYDKARADFEESVSSERFFRGRFIETLRRAALDIIRDDRRLVDQVPVGLLPTLELNACAIATPRGGAVIVLDHGVMGQLALVLRCALAFITWYDHTPFCRDSPQRAYAEALIGLARFCVTGSVDGMAQHRETLSFPSLGDYDNETMTFSFLMQVFILLHEYGHVVRGHLSANRLRPAFAGRCPRLREYTKSEVEEFEADEYAVRQLLRAGIAKGLRSTDVAWVVGLLFKFFDLCELVTTPAAKFRERTHPPAVDRWERVKAQTLLSGMPGAFAGNLDPAFAVLHRMIETKGA